jgi:hypothetical protein
MTAGARARRAGTGGCQRVPALARGRRMERRDRV